VRIYCETLYITPQERNSYKNHYTFSYEDLKNGLNYVIKQNEIKSTKEYRTKMERAKMTDSLRYDVFKRDDFRCKLCGKTAADGITLHVDHIIPVSKGGRTTMSNLQTLCDMCNFGKRDKI
jgi:5-methylcytosine-specific restriction endonuclease McrA